MKKINLPAIFAAVAALVMSGCAGDVTPPREEGNVKFSSNITAASNVSTRVSGEAGDQWDGDEEIGIYMYTDALATGTANAHYNLATTGGDFEPAATGDILYYPGRNVQTSFMAYYPYKAGLEDVDNVYPVDISVQTGNIDLMYAAPVTQSTGKVNLTFAHKLSRLIFVVTDSTNGEMDGVTSLVGGLPTTASFNLAAASPEVSGQGNVKEFAAKYVDATDNIARVEAIVLPGEELDYTIQFVLRDGTSATLTMTDKTYQSGKQYKYNVTLNPAMEIAYVSSESIEGWGVGNGENGEDVVAKKKPVEPGVIMSTAQFLAFVNTVNDGAQEYQTRATGNADPAHGDYTAWLVEEGQEQVVKLGANIAIPTTTATEGAIKCWDGIFDGGGYTITIETPTSPLFHSVFGTVRNLNIATTQGNVMNTFRGSEMPGAVPFVSALHGGTLLNCSSSIPVFQNGWINTSIAGICYQAFDGVIEGCTNSGDLTIQASGSLTGARVLNIGGIVAYAGDQMTQASASGTNDSFVSGVKIIDCTNTGNLKIENTGSIASGTWTIIQAAAGGIVGFITGGLNSPGEYAEITGCSNRGNVTLTDLSVSECASGVGGIVGWSGAYSVSTAGCATIIGKLYGSQAVETDQQDGFYSKIMNCSNSGAIYNARTMNSSTYASNALRKYGTGGIAGLLFGSITTSDGLAVVSGCENTGTVTAGLATANPSDSRGGMVGGIVGYGGGVAISNCTVKATLGDITRQTFSVGGVIGGAYNKFTVTGCKVDAQINRYNINQTTALANFAAMIHGGSSVLARNAGGGGFTWMNGSAITDCGIKGSVTTRLASDPATTVAIENAADMNMAPFYAMAQADITKYVTTDQSVVISGTYLWDGQ